MGEADVLCILVPRHLDETAGVAFKQLIGRLVHVYGLTIADGLDGNMQHLVRHVAGQAEDDEFRVPIRVEQAHREGEGTIVAFGQHVDAVPTVNGDVVNDLLL